MVFQNGSRHSIPKWRSMAAMDYLARPAKPQFSGSATPATSVTIAPAVKPRGVYWRIADYRAYCVRIGLAVWTSSTSTAPSDDGVELRIIATAGHVESGRCSINQPPKQTGLV